MADRYAFEKRAGGWLAGAGDALVSVFFPAGCRLCDRVLLRASAVPICEECLGSSWRLEARVAKDAVSLWRLGR